MGLGVVDEQDRRHAAAPGPWLSLPHRRGRPAACGLSPPAGAAPRQLAREDADDPRAPRDLDSGERATRAFCRPQRPTQRRDTAARALRAGFGPLRARDRSRPALHGADARSTSRACTIRTARAARSRRAASDSSRRASARRGRARRQRPAAAFPRAGMDAPGVSRVECRRGIRRRRARTQRRAAIGAFRPRTARSCWSNRTARSPTCAPWRASSRPRAQRRAARSTSSACASTSPRASICCPVTASGSRSCRSRACRSGSTTCASTSPATCTMRGFLAPAAARSSRRSRRGSPRTRSIATARSGRSGSSRASPRAASRRSSRFITAWSTASPASA